MCVSMSVCLGKKVPFRSGPPFFGRCLKTLYRFCLFGGGGIDRCLPLIFFTMGSAYHQRSINLRLRGVYDGIKAVDLVFNTASVGV